MQRRAAESSTTSTAAPSRPGVVRRTAGRLLRTLGLIGLGLTVSGTPVAAQAQAKPQPQAIPQHWISYAQLASNQFEAWLSDPASDAVVRLHAWMQERMLQEGQPIAAPLVVRVWVAANGNVERLDFASLGQAQADTDLRALLTAQPLSEPPPRDMRQPMVLQLTLGFTNGA